MSDSRTELGACHGLNPEMWFPNHAGNQAESWEQEHRAKAVCAGCPLRDECLQLALDTKERHGIWGGLNPDERAMLLGGRSPAQHGTDGGFYAHRRRTRPGWTYTPCDECRAAHREAERIRHARKAAAA